MYIRLHIYTEYQVHLSFSIIPIDILIQYMGGDFDE